jgi:signal transduction histidine kinase
VRHWRVASRLALLLVIPVILGLTLAGLQVSSDLGRAGTYGQVGRLSALGQQVTGLAQALEQERSAAALFIAHGHPDAGLAALRRQYAVTDAQAVSVRRLAGQIGRAHAQPLIQANAATALASITGLPALRRSTAQGQASALEVTSGYSAAITGLFPVVDGIADLSTQPGLISSVRALGSLARLKDQVTLQQAILGAAFAAGRFAPGQLMALNVAQAAETSDIAAFRSSATPQESWALASTLAAAPARQARAVQQHAAGDGTLAPGPAAIAQWQAGVAYTAGWMRGAEQQLTSWIRADARAQQQNATRSAIITGSAAGAGLLLAALIAVLIVGSVVRPLRRLEAAALEAAEARLPADIQALTAGADAAPPHPARPAAALSSGDEIGQVARAIDRLHAEAVRMAGEEARLRDSADVVMASFFRRSHPLNDRLLRLIDSMELSEDDPERLGRLFQADSLATRMRRHSDTALVLSGHEPPPCWTEPVALVDILRAAASEIEDYDQVAFDVQAGVMVSEGAAVDTVHLLAELLENATAFSPEASQVLVSGYLDPAGGALIGIADAGPGLSDDQLRWLNWQLAHPPDADLRVAQQLGLFAVAHLAERHGISVVLTQAPGGGTTAEVFLPPEMIIPDAAQAAGTAALGSDYGRAGSTTSLAASPRITAGPPAAPDPAPGQAPGAAGPPGDGDVLEDEIPRPADAPVPAPAPVSPGAATEPWPAPAPATEPGPAGTAATEPGPAGTAAGSGQPIFEAVESESRPPR